MAETQKLSASIDAGTEIAQETLARATTDGQFNQLVADLKAKLLDLKSQQTAGSWENSEKYAKQIKVIYQMAKDLWSIKSKLKEARMAPTKEAEFGGVTLKYDHKKLDVVGDAYDATQDLLEVHTKIRKRDTKKLQQFVQEVRMSGNMKETKAKALREEIAKILVNYKHMDMLEGVTLEPKHPLAEFQKAYHEAGRFLATVQLYEDKTTTKAEKLENTITKPEEQIAFLSDINDSGEVQAFNKTETHWYKADTLTQESIIGEQQLFQALSDYVKNDGTVEKAYKFVTGESAAPDFTKEKAKTTRETFIKALENKVSAYTTLASTLLSVSDKTLVSGGLVAIIEGKEDKYRQELVNLAGDPGEIKKRVTEAQKNLSSRERKNFWERVASALGKIGLGALLGPIHFAIHTETLGNRGLVADAGGKDVTAKAMIRGILPEIEGSIESQNQVFKISEDWGKLLKSSVNQDNLEINITDTKKFSDIADRMQKLLQANAKNDEKIPASTAETRLRDMVIVLNTNFAKDRETIEWQNNASIKVKYIDGSIASARDTLGVTLASALQDPVKWSPMIGVSAGLQGIGIDFIKREKTSKKVSLGTDGENAVSGAEQKATDDPRKLKDDFKIDMKEAGGKYTYTFGNKEGMFRKPVFENGIRFESDGITIISTEKLKFIQRDHYSQGFATKELVVRKLTAQELDAIKKHNEAIATNETIKKAYGALKESQGGGSDIGNESNEKRASLKTKVTAIHAALKEGGALGKYVTTKIRLHLSGLQKTAREALRGGTPGKWYDALVGFKYGKEKREIFDAAKNETDPYNQAILLEEFLKATAGDHRVRDPKKGTTLGQLYDSNAWGGKAYSAFDRIRKGEDKEIPNSDIKTIHDARKSIHDQVINMTPAEATKTIPNAVSFITFAQALYHADGTFDRNTFTGSVPVSGSINVLGKPVNIDSAKHTKERRIKEIPVFVLESFMRQINDQIDARNEHIMNYNKTVTTAQLKLLGRINKPEQVRSLMLGVQIPEVGVIKINSNFVYSGYEKCVNDVESLMNIKPEFPTVPNFPDNPPELDVPKVAEAAREASASTGKVAVESTTIQGGVGARYGSNELNKALWRTDAHAGDSSGELGSGVSGT